MEALKDVPISAETLLDQLQQSVITTDLQGCITSWNQGAEQLYGYSAEEALGRPISLIYADGDGELSAQLGDPQALPWERNACEAEGWRLRKDGRKVFVRVRIIPLVSPQGDHAGYIAYGVDITRHQQALEAIRRTQDSLVDKNALYEALLKAQSDVGEGVIIIENEKVTYANEAICQLLGYTPEEFHVLPSFAELCDPSCRDLVVSNHRRRLAGEQLAKRYEIVALTKDGRQKEVEIAVATIPAGTGFRVVVVVVDITEKKQARARLAYLSSVVEQTNDGVMLTDLQGRIEYVNAGLEKTTGYRRDELIGRTSALLRSGVHPPAFYERMWRTILAGEEFRDIFVNRRKDGTLYHAEKTITPIRDGAGRITHFSSIEKDVTERFQAQERIEYLALHDTLTGLANRMLLMDRLRAAVAMARRKHKRFGVFFLDLDGFKPINDEFGHKGGDLVLHQVGRRMAELVRESDTVARIGGDEFVMLLDDLEDDQAIAAVAEKLLAAVGEPIAVYEAQRRIGASIGIAVYPEHGADEDSLLQAADRAMYEAKRLGKNRYCLAGAAPGR